VTSWSLVQRSLPGVCLIVCSLETSTMRRPNTHLGLAPRKKKHEYFFLSSVLQPRYCTDIAPRRIVSLLRHWWGSSLIGSFTLPPPPQHRRLAYYLPSKENSFCYSSRQWYLVSVVIIVICYLYPLLLSHAHFPLLHIPTVHRYGEPRVFMGKFDSESRWDNIVTGY